MLTRELDSPGKGILDRYLLQFVAPRLARAAWGSNILTMKGLDGLDEDNQIDGDLSTPDMAEKYRQLEKRRGYSYVAAQTQGHDRDC